ncbi:lipoprotein, putative [Staphylococcus aureus]|nr:lipoprotein, putative [Staphylococcus aureus]
MKKLVTGLLALSLFLAACGQDSDQQKDSNKEKDDRKLNNKIKKQMIHLKIRKTIKMIVKT